jgi:hypothetical protein
MTRNEARLYAGLRLKIHGFAREETIQQKIQST